MVSLLLMAAVMVSLAGGVLIAYGICLGMFALIRRHVERTARAHTRLAQVGVASEG